MLHTISRLPAGGGSKRSRSWQRYWLSICLQCQKSRCESARAVTGSR